MTQVPLDKSAGAVIDALDARIDRLGILRDGLQRVSDTQLEVGKRLHGLRSRLADSGS